MATFFWKAKNVQTLNVLLVKNIDRFFKCEKFNYKRPLLRAVELAILFYWFLNRSKADENSTIGPISNTNFSNKAPISESYH